MKEAHKWIVIPFVLILSVVSAHAQTSLLVNAFPGLSFTKPLFITHSGDGTNRLFVVQQDGYIRVFKNDSTAATRATFLDFSRRISSYSGEEGLLGLAFHPNYRNNGYFFIDYTEFAPGSHTFHVVVSRFRVSTADPNRADSSSEVRLLEIDKTEKNHNGGMLAFGPDGYLYVAVGDGGGENDPDNNGQSRSTLFGKILRIDVDHPNPGRSYGIPTDNPFPGQGQRGEIWAYGLRNPWRFSFDQATGDLWVGDVGQSAREEVDIVTKGGNYGWKIMEGRICRPGGGNCDSTGLTLPIKDYDHSQGEAITGGYVYRGKKRPDLDGAYIYSDWGSGKVWMLRYDGSRLTADSLLAATGLNIASFGVDENNELYLASWGDGRILRFAGSVQPDTSHPPATLPIVLSQNTPNPATSTTAVAFHITAPGPVSLIVYDILGREVLTVVDKPMDAGSYSFPVDVTSLASGAYYYRLLAPGVEEVRQMLVVR